MVWVARGKCLASDVAAQVEGGRRRIRVEGVEVSKHDTRVRVLVGKQAPKPCYGSGSRAIVAQIHQDRKYGRKK